MTIIWTIISVLGVISMIAFTLAPLSEIKRKRWAKINRLISVCRCGLIIIGFVSFKAFQEVKESTDWARDQCHPNWSRQDSKKQSRLEDRIGYFQTPEFQEKVAKDKLNFQKNDEEVVIIKSSPRWGWKREWGQGFFQQHINDRHEAELSKMVAIFIWRMIANIKAN